MDILQLLMSGLGGSMPPQDQNGGAAPGLPVPPGAAPSPFNTQSVPPPPAAEPDIVVGGAPVDKPKYKSGILGGAFAGGKTGGNILGILGDALRAQAGMSELYAPQLQQLRESEALQNYRTDPTGSLDKYLMVNPEKGLAGYNTYEDNQRADRATNTVIRDKDTDYENVVRGRIGSMLYASNAKTFPQVLSQAKAYAASKGVTLDLPATFEEAQSWAMGDVPVDKQIASSDMRDYRAATLADRQAANEARAAYYRSNIAERGAYHKGVLKNNDPGAKPPSPTSVLGKVMDKVQTQGLSSLTPGERQVYDDQFKGKTGGKGAGAAGNPKIVRDPVTGKVTISK